MLREDIYTARGTFAALAGIAMLLLAVATVGIVLCFRYPDSFLGIVCLFVGLLAFPLGVIPIHGIRDAIHRNADIKVLAAIESFVWQPSWVERKYTEELTRHLLAGVEDAQHQVPAHEARTQFDIIVKYRGEDWLITAKKGLDNQQRLTLQGEVEDFIARWNAKRGRRIHVVVVLGFDDKALRDLTTQEQKKTLIGHLELRRRGLMNRREMPDRKWRELEYDVCVVHIAAVQPASTRSIGELAGAQDAQGGIAGAS